MIDGFAVFRDILVNDDQNSNLEESLGKVDELKSLETSAVNIAFEVSSHNFDADFFDSRTRKALIVAD